MSVEDLAQTAADKFAAAETAIRDLIDAVQAVKNPCNIPPVTFLAIKGALWGALGSVADAHLRITPFDPRPHPLDSGGK